MAILAWQLDPSGPLLSSEKADQLSGAFEYN